MASLLKKFVDAEQWDAEDIVGRLGMVLHAAFLFAGFQPYGAQPRSGHSGQLLKKQSRKKGGSLCLSRQYTAPDLAHRDCADAAVLMLCAQGSDVALLVFLTTATDGDDMLLENAYLEQLDLGTVRPLLSHSLGGVEARASRICKALADGVCWGLLDELCRRNSLPMTGFTSLPSDLKGVVLEKLTDGKDLAMVECVSSQLRLLVAERGHELWKTLYKGLPALQCHTWHLWRIFPYAQSWKDKYVQARRCPMSIRRFNFFDPIQMTRFDFFDPIQMIRLRELPSWAWPLLVPKGGKRSCRIVVRQRKSSWPFEYWLFQHPSSQEDEEKVSMRVERSSGHSRKLQAQNDCKKKWNGGGAIHSPSSRYRWKHR